MQRVYRRRRLTVGVAALAVVLAVGWVIAGNATGGGGTPPPAGAVASIEAGLEPWQLPVAISRESVVPSPTGFTVLGGLTSSGTSTDAVTSFTPLGSSRPGAPLSVAVHDAAAVAFGTTAVVAGGGSPTTIATVQQARPGGARAVVGSLPAPRSDAVGVSVVGSSGTTGYVVGGYTGSSYLPQVLATTDGQTFRSVATLPVAVRYPAVAAVAGELYVLGGEVPGAGSAVAATADVQAVDPATGAASIVATLPRPLYGATAFTFGGVVYVAGGATPGGTTLAEIDAFVPASHKVLFAGLLPQAVAFAGGTTLGAGTSTVGYLVGGEVAHQGGSNQAGVPAGTLRTVLALRPSRYGGPAGTSSAGSPFTGRLLIADRGNDRLILITPGRQITWTYPAPGRPAPKGGFYFPDDAFFFDHGRGIVSNQEDNDTIVEIAFPSGRVLWDVGHPKSPGSGPGYYNQPDDAYVWRNGLVSVADASNNVIKFIARSGAVVGRIGNGTDAHVPGVSIAYPNGDTPTPSGDVLVSEVNGSWVDEYTPSGHLVWTVHLPSVAYPSDPQPLGGDRYLMTDYNPAAEGKVIEFTSSGRIVWRYDARSGDAMLRMPSLAERLPNGLIMVNDDYRDRMVAIDPTTGMIVWQYGLTDVAGTAPGLLAIPDGFDLLEPGGITPTHPWTG